MKQKRGILVGTEGGTHLGGSLWRAAQRMSDYSFHFVDSLTAYQGSYFARKLAYHFFDKRPLMIRDFNRNLLLTCKDFKPDFLIATGAAPLLSETLKCLGNMGIKRFNYLTDDPWNRAHRCRWFLEALPHYDAVFSVRRTNMNDLIALNCQRVFYLPFGYDSDLFYPENPTEEQRHEYASDVLFIGGADKDRLPYAKAFIQAGYNIRLYGGYWDRFHETKPYAFGLLDPAAIRLITSCAKVSLCLVRRANRDDNCMRSFEIPAIGGCMLAEDTPGHRQIFGSEGDATLYFKTPNEMLDKAQFLLKNTDERQRLSSAAHTKILRGKHTYYDRLTEILRETHVDG